MSKSPDAFRTISEVADWLGVQAHVLRFWESKFTQVKPVKRAGGRRYYRPADMLLLGGIRKLLHDDGLTIKGVQKILREQGMAHVSDMSAPLDDDTLGVLDADMVSTPPAQMTEAEEAPAVGAVLPFAPAKETPKAKDSPKEPPAPSAEPQEAAPEVAEPDTAEAALEKPETSEPPADVTAEPPTPKAPPPPQATESPAQPAPPTPEAPAAPTPEPETEPEPKPQPAAEDAAPEHVALPSFMSRGRSAPDDTPNAVPDDAGDPAPETAAQDTPPAQPEPAARPRVIDAPDPPPEDQIDASPRALSGLVSARTAISTRAKDVRPLLAQLTALRDRMTAPQSPRPKE